MSNVKLKMMMFSLDNPNNERLDDRRKEKEEAAKYGEVPDSEGEESDEEPEVILKDVVISGANAQLFTITYSAKMKFCPKL